MQKTTLSIVATIFLVGCASNQPQPHIVVDRDVDYVPNLICPVPNKIEPTILPIAMLTKNSSAKEIATAYVNSIAVLKADLSAAMSELKRYEEYGLGKSK